MSKTIKQMGPMLAMFGGTVNGRGSGGFNMDLHEIANKKCYWSFSLFACRRIKHAPKIVEQMRTHEHNVRQFLDCQSIK